MNHPVLRTLFFACLIFCFSCNTDNTPEQPEKFLPDLVSTTAVEYGIDFSPSGDSCFFVRHNGAWGKSKNPPANIYLITKQNGAWVTPELASFSQDSTNDDDVFISPSGNSLFFTSNRFYPGKNGRGSDIWKMDKRNGEWGTPYPLDSLINSPNMESSPVTNRNGDLYFTSIREEGPGQGDIYVAKIKADGSYEAPVVVPNVNSEHGEWNVFVEPDEQRLILESSGRPEGKSGYGDLYLSENIGGEWQSPKSITLLNTTGSELNVRLGPQKKFLYYACSFSLESENVDILKVSVASILEEYLH